MTSKALKIGDTVRRTDRRSKFFGATGTVLLAEPELIGSALVRFPLTGSHTIDRLLPLEILEIAR